VVGALTYTVALELPCSMTGLGISKQALAICGRMASADHIRKAGHDDDTLATLR
jgi:hypothetical protein